VTSRELLADDVVRSWLTDHHGWQLRDDHLVRHLRTRDYPSAVEILAAQVPLAERLNHHPVVSVGYCDLVFEVWTHDRSGVTQLDVEYAESLDDLVSTRFAAVLVAT
jgi:4a-hydroxytetrahydrobiopterin dehydratase